MHKNLTQYFAQTGYLVLPKIGIIKWIKQDAIWEKSTIKAPEESIVFEITEAKPNKLFYYFLSEQLAVSYDQAIIQFDQFIEHHFNKEQLPFELGKFGSLTKKEGQYHWTSNFNSKTYYKNIEINPIDLPEETAPNNNLIIKWYVWAILLTFIAMAAILFKFL